MNKILPLVTLVFLSAPAFAMVQSTIAGNAKNTVQEPEHIENIEVWGQKTKPQLKREFELAKMEFIEIFNALNDIHKFEVVCERRRPVGSHIAVRECESRYIKDERAFLIGLAFNLRPKDRQFVRGPTDATVKLNTEHERRQGYQHLAKLIQESDELRAQWQKLEALSAKIND